MKKCLLSCLFLALLGGCGGSDPTFVFNQEGVAPVSPFPVLAFVANRDGESITSYFANVLTGELTLVETVGVGTDILSLSIHPSGRFLYGGGYKKGGLVGYQVNAETAGLVPLPDFPIATPAEGSAILNHQGTLLFMVLNQQIEVYRVNQQDGTVTPTDGSPFVVPGMAEAFQGVIDNTDQFLFVSDQGSNQIFTFQIDVGGAPTLLGSTASGGDGPQDMLIDSTNRRLYVSHLEGTIYGFDLNQATGHIAPLPGFPVVFGTKPALVGRMALTDTHLFVPEQFGDQLSAFSYHSDTGALTPVPGYPRPFGGSGADFLPGSPYLYGTHSDVDNVPALLVHPDGTSEPLAGSPFPAGDYPTDIQFVKP